MLSAQELVDWMALSRVHAGGLVHYHGEYLDSGALMSRYLIPELLFDVLVRVGLLKLQPDLILLLRKLDGINEGLKMAGSTSWGLRSKTA